MTRYGDIRAKRSPPKLRVEQTIPADRVALGQAARRGDKFDPGAPQPDPSFELQGLNEYSGLGYTPGSGGSGGSAIGTKLAMSPLGQALLAHLANKERERFGSFMHRMGMDSPTDNEAAAKGAGKWGTSSDFAHQLVGGVPSDGGAQNPMDYLPKDATPLDVILYKIELQITLWWEELKRDWEAWKWLWENADKDKGYGPTTYPIEGQSGLFGTGGTQNPEDVPPPIDALAARAMARLLILELVGGGRLTGEWIHSNAGDDAEGGGGAGGGPTSALLGGMEHPSDWVAGLG